MTKGILYFDKKLDIVTIRLYLLYYIVYNNIFIVSKDEEK